MRRTANGNGAGSILKHLTEQSPDWATKAGPGAAVVLTSRVRLARNLASLPFPAQTGTEEQQQVISRVRRAARDVPALGQAAFLEIDTLEETDRNFLVERRLISRDLAAGARRRGVLLAEGEGLTVMVNEEDHFRLQSVVSGLRLGEAYDRINEVDSALDAGLDYAYNEELGFLTACPTNVGTGMRASVLAHLPALVLTRRAKKIIQGVTAMGLAVRGFYGEGSEIMGNFFQISNQATLGKGENEILSRLGDVVGQVLTYEQDAQRTMWKSARVQVEDKIYRALGTLRSARSISADEVVSLASAVRFGIALELPGLCPLPALNEILVFSQPGHITRRAGRALETEERRELRAEYIRHRLSEPEVTEPLDADRGIASEGPSSDVEE